MTQQEPRGARRFLHVATSHGQDLVTPTCVWPQVEGRRRPWQRGARWADSGALGPPAAPPGWVGPEGGAGPEAGGSVQAEACGTQRSLTLMGPLTSVSFVPQTGRGHTCTRAVVTVATRAQASGSVPSPGSRPRQEECGSTRGLWV